MNCYECYFAQDAWAGRTLTETGVSITTKLLNHFRKGMASLLSCDVQGWNFKKSATIRLPWSSFSFYCFYFISPYSLLASKHHVKAKKSVSRTFNSIRFNVYFLVSYWGIHVCNLIYHGKWLLSSQLLSQLFFLSIVLWTAANFDFNERTGLWGDVVQFVSIPCQFILCSPWSPTNWIWRQWRPGELVPRIFSTLNMATTIPWEVHILTFASKNKILSEKCNS